MDKKSLEVFRAFKPVSWVILQSDLQKFNIKLKLRRLWTPIRKTELCLPILITNQRVTSTNQ